MERDTSTLVKLALEGDKDAFSALVCRHWESLVRLARSVVGFADAEDVVQEGLIVAWKKLPALRNPEAFASWATRIVSRRCFRHAKNRPFSVVLGENLEVPCQAPQEADCDIEKLLSRLAPKQRAVMHFTVIEGMSDSEISARLGIRKSSVRSHRRRARESLARNLAGKEMIP